VSEPDCRVADRVASHEERCTDQPRLDPCRYRILKHGTRDRQRACGVEDIGTSCCADAGYDTVVLLRMSVGSTHFRMKTGDRHLRRLSV
jgi:hypothetical protein